MRVMPRILLAEDDAIVRELSAHALRRAGFEVVCAADGQAAWDLLDTAEPDLILLDLAMPTLDGLSFLRRLRAHERWGGVPVLVVSAHLSAAEYAASHGAQGHLIKSRFAMAELIALVTRLTSTSKEKRGTSAA
jgi:CheY-like chemotaxis protein